jgi:hypothetical protein
LIEDIDAVIVNGQRVTHPGTQAARHTPAGRSHRGETIAKPAHHALQSLAAALSSRSRHPARLANQASEGRVCVQIRTDPAIADCVFVTMCASRPDPIVQTRQSMKTVAAVRRRA